MCLYIYIYIVDAYVVFDECNIELDQQINKLKYIHEHSLTYIGTYIHVFEHAVLLMEGSLVRGPNMHIHNYARTYIQTRDTH